MTDAAKTDAPVTDTPLLFAARIFTEDVDGLIAFYEQVTGLTANRLHPLFAELITPSGTLAVASTDTVPLLGDGLARSRANHSVSLDFLVADVDVRYEALKDSGFDLLNQPTTMPWGNRSLLIRDPDGHLINLFSPVTPAARERFGLHDVS